MLKQNGFTLFELLLAIAFVAAMTAFLVPQLITFNNRQNTASAAKDLVTAFNTAQNHAGSGVQTGEEFVQSYRLSLNRDPGDVEGDYVGYSMVRISEDDSPVGDPLLEKSYLCPVCIISLQSQFDFRVPTGRVQNITEPVTLQVCRPEAGFYEIEIDPAGKISSGQFTSGTCSCSRSSCNN